MPIDVTQGATEDPFADLIPKSGDLESLTPKLDQYGLFHDLVAQNDPAPAASYAYDNLVGGGTKDAEAYQKTGEIFSPVPRGVAVSTTQEDPFSDLARAGTPRPITNYQEEFGIFADMVPQSPAPEVDRQAYEGVTFKPKGTSVEDYLVARERSLVAGGEPPELPKQPSLLTRLAAQERERVIEQSKANYRGEEISAPRDVRQEQLGAGPGGELYDLSKQNAIDSAIAGFGHSAITSLGDIVTGAAGLAVQHPNLREDSNAQDKIDWINSSPDPLLQWARQAPELAQKAFPVKEGIAGDIGKEVGAFAPLVAAGPFAPFVMAMQDAGAHISNDYRALLESGMRPAKAAQQTFNNATASGLTDEAVWSVLPAPLRAAGDRYLVEKFGTDRLKAFLAGRVAQGTEGAVLGAASRMAQNTASGENLLEGVGPSALGLGVIQALLPRGGERGAIKEGKQPEGVQTEPKDRTARGPTEETSLSDRLLGPTEGGPETVGPQETYSPHDLRPALRVPDLGDIPGQKGQTHQQIYESLEDPTAVRASEPEHGFMDPNGNFLTREQAAKALGETEPLQSERLIELQKEAPPTTEELPKGEEDQPKPPSEAPKGEDVALYDKVHEALNDPNTPYHVTIDYVSQLQREGEKNAETLVDFKKRGARGKEIQLRGEITRWSDGTYSFSHKWNTEWNNGSEVWTGRYPSRTAAIEALRDRVKEEIRSQSRPYDLKNKPLAGKRKNNEALLKALEEQLPEKGSQDVRTVKLSDDRTIEVMGNGPTTYWRAPDQGLNNFILASPEFRKSIEEAEKVSRPAGGGGETETTVVSPEETTAPPSRKERDRIAQQEFDDAVKSEGTEIFNDEFALVPKEGGGGTIYRRTAKGDHWTPASVYDSTREAEMQKTWSQIKRQGAPTTGKPVTPAQAETKIEQQIKDTKELKKAGVGPTAQRIKEEIIARVQGALDKLLEENLVELKQDPSGYRPERYEIVRPGEHRYLGADITESSPGKWQAIFKEGSNRETIKGTSFQDVSDKLKARFSEGEGKVTFHIPGDGTFTLLRSGKALTDLLKRAQAMKTGEAPLKTPTVGMSRETLQKEIARREKLIETGRHPSYGRGQGEKIKPVEMDAIKNELRSLRDRQSTSSGYPPEDFYAQQLHETMGKTAALADQREQLGHVKKGSEAAKIIQKTIDALESFPEDEKPRAPEPAPAKAEEPTTPPADTLDLLDEISSWPDLNEHEFAESLGKLTNMKFEDLVPGMRNNGTLALARAMPMELGQAIQSGIRPGAEVDYRGDSVKVIRIKVNEDRNRWDAEIESDKIGQKTVPLDDLEGPENFQGGIAEEIKDVQGSLVFAPEAPVTTRAEKGMPPEQTQGGVSVGSPPLKPLPPTSVKTPKSQRQIITDLARGMNVPIRFGRLLSRKFAGYFLPKQNLIASRKADSLPVVTHEIGHKFDREFKLSSDKSIAAELDTLGDPQTKGSMSSWTKSKTKKYKMGEGVAEFMRYWLTDPQHAQAVAPNTFKTFEALLDANKDMGDVLRTAQDDIETLRAASFEERLGSQISEGDNPNKTPYTMSQLTRDLVDDLHFVRLPFMELRQRLGGVLSPAQDAYILARNLRGAYGMAASFIRDGVADFKTKAVTLGTSLEDALKPVGGRITEFKRWIVAKQAAELHRLGKETGLRADDVLRMVAKYDQDQDFQKAFADLKVWRTHLIKYAVDSGLLSPKSAINMLKLYQDYVPLHRVFEVGAGEPPAQDSGGAGRGLNVGKPGSFRRRAGSTRQIVDPIETLIKDAYTIITASEKAAINRAIADLWNKPDMGKWVEKVPAPKEAVRVGLEKIREQLEDAGADLSKVDDDLALMFYRNSGRAPYGENIIRIVRNDKPEFYRLNRDLYNTFQALDLEDNSKLIRYMAVPGSLLRSGVVLEPSFALANVLRDAFSSAVISRHGALPFEAILRGTAALLHDPELVSRWKASGGANAIEINFFDRQKLQKYYREKITKDLTPFERALVVTKSPLTALRYITAFSEEATRIGEFQIAYNKYLKGGMPEGEASRLAAFEARDRQDFAKGGAITKIPRALTPFWNANLQGNVALAQAFKSRPIRTLAQGIAFVTLPKLLEQAVNWNDEDYWDRPQWERDLFFMIPAGKDSTGHTRFIRIPTPFEVGLVFGSLPGRLLQGLKKGAAGSMQDFPNTILNQTVPNPIPQGIQVLFEDFMTGKQGWDIYRGRPIVPDSLADRAPELQYTSQTSALAKKVGATLHFSPMKIDHIIGQTTGGMGKLLTGAQPLGKRFVTTPVRLSSKTIDDFYTGLANLENEADRVKAGTSTADVEAVRDYRKAAKQMGELRTASRLTSDQKTKDELEEQIYQIAKETLRLSPPPK